MKSNNQTIKQSNQWRNFLVGILLILAFGCESELGILDPPLEEISKKFSFIFSLRRFG